MPCRMIPTWTHWASNNALRMIPNMSGLFDTGSTGVTAARLTSVDSLDLSWSGEASGVGDMTNIGADFTDLTTLDTDVLPDFTDHSDFCEVFTDLSQLLQQEEENEMDLSSDMMDISSPTLPAAEATVCTAGGKAVKRTASQASLPESPPPYIPDHCDYTAKCTKRRRKAPELDAIELVEGSVDIDGVTMNKVEKYAERRRKNNIASRRSRETRKQKHRNLEQQAIDLENENKALALKVEQLERLTKEMKDLLVQKLAHGK